MPARRRDNLIPAAGVGLIALGILFVIALAGGSKSLGKFSLVIVDRGINNYLGRLSWIVPMLCLYWGWKLIIGTRIYFDIGVSALVWLAYTFLSSLSYGIDLRGSNLGGQIGGYLGEVFVHSLGRVGSLIVLGAGLIIILVISAGIDLKRGALWLQERFLDFLRIFRDAFGGEESQAKSREPRRMRRRPAIVSVEESPKEVKPQKSCPMVTKEQEAESRMITQKAMQTSEDSAGRAEYRRPPLSLFKRPSADVTIPQQELQELASYLEDKIGSFGIDARVTEIHPGPVITRFEIEPGSSTKVHQVVNLADDLALALKARSIRILAPIPGKGAIGIEVPNRNPSPVLISEVLASPRFEQAQSRLEIALGKDVAGNPYTADLEAMPHLLIAGATGSGKSVCINAIITSLVYRNSPQDVQLILIDPKRLELSQYEAIPHLLCEVVTDAKKAVRALNWVIEEMDTRYQLLARRGVRNIRQYEEGLPYIVVVIDELADLMLVMPQEIESAVTKLAQMARAVGIHLVMATQRPSVDVITGVIKANFPCRIALKVASKIDSRTIIDVNGAERLLGRGDMLFVAPGTAEPIRLHGAFVSHEETRRLAEFLRKQSHLAAPCFSVENVEPRQKPLVERDELFEDAARIVITHGQGSVSLLQRRLKIGYSRAARLIDFLEEAGIVGPFEGSKARQVLVDESYLENLSQKS